MCCHQPFPPILISGFKVDVYMCVSCPGSAFDLGSGNILKSNSPTTGDGGPKAPFSLEGRAPHLSIVLPEFDPSN